MSFFFFSSFFVSGLQLYRTVSSRVSSPLSRSAAEPRQSQASHVSLQECEEGAERAASVSNARLSSDSSRCANTIAGSVLVAPRMQQETIILWLPTAQLGVSTPPRHSVELNAFRLEAVL